MNTAEIEAEIGRLVVRMAEWMAAHGGDDHSLVLMATDFGDGRFLVAANLKDKEDLSTDDPCVYYSGLHRSLDAAVLDALVGLGAKLELNEKKEKVEK